MTTKSKSHNKHKNKNAGHNKNKKKINNNNNNNIDNKNNNNNNNNNNNCYKCTKIPTYNIRVGEHDFCLSSESLNYDAPNFFTAAFLGYFSESKTTSIFIERDPTYFSMIVRYLRGYQVNWPINDKISMNNLLEDVKFYSFGKLQNFLEEIYEKTFPENVIPWKILTYAPENDPVVILNIKDVELNRWDSHSLVYDTNPIEKSVNEQNGNDNENNDNDTDNDNDNDNNDVNENNDVEDDATDNAAADNDDNNNDNDNDNDVANANNADDIVEPNADKGLHRLEVHGNDALTTVTSNHNNGIKFENFTLKNPAEEETFRAITKSFRSPDGSLTLSPSLKLPFLKDSCIEIDGSKYYTYKELFDYFGVTARGKQLYFEEFVLRIIDGAFLMRARALTIPFYYASQSSF